MSETIRSRLLGMVNREEVGKQPEAKKVEPPKAETPVETPAAPTQADAPKEEEKKEEPKPKKSKAPAKIIQAPETPIGEVVARAATEAAVAAVKATQPKAPETPEPEIPKDIQRKLDYYKELEQLDPKYKGITQKVVEFSRKGGVEEKYIADWRKANPGKQFDAEAEEHEDFYSQNAPDYDETDFDVAKEQVIERRAVEKAKKAMEPELNKQREREIEREVEPVLTKASYDIAAGALSAISEDLVKIAAEKGDAGLQEADPLALQIASQVIPAYEPVAHETVRLFSGLSRYNEKNPSPVHQQINDIALRLDQVIGQIDREQALKPVVKSGRVVGHQRFATYAEWERMSEAERANHWIVGQDEVLAHISALAKRDTKAQYDQIVTAATKTLGAKVGQKTPAAAPAAEQKTAAAPTPKPSSPTISSSAPTPTPTAGGNEDGDPKRRVFARMFRVMR